MKKLSTLSMSAAALISVAASMPAKADLMFSGTGTDGSNPLAATVDFTLTGTTFQIVLTNLDQSFDPAGVLTNLNVVTAPAPATSLPGPAGSISLTAGSSIIGSVGSNGTLSQNWAYIAGSAGGAASSGFGVGNNAPGGVGNLCGTANCGVMLDGLEYGIAGPGTDITQSNFQGTNNHPLVDDSVTIDITLASNSTFTLADITSVQFQFGTGNGEPTITVDACTGGSDCGHSVPEPASLALFGSALVGLGALRRRRRRTTA